MAYSKKVVEKFENTLNNPEAFNVGRFDPKESNVYSYPEQPAFLMPMMMPSPLPRSLGISVKWETALSEKFISEVLIEFIITLIYCLAS